MCNDQQYKGKSSPNYLAGEEETERIATCTHIVLELIVQSDLFLFCRQSFPALYNRQEYKLPLRLGMGVLYQCTPRKLQQNSSSARSIPPYKSRDILDLQSVQFCSTMAIHQCVKIVVVLVAVAGGALAKEFRTFERGRGSIQFVYRNLINFHPSPL